MLTPTSAMAACEPTATWGTDCPDDCWMDATGTDDNVIYYYIESDFGDELSDCTATSSDNSLTEDQIRDVIHSAAERWNLDSHSAALVFGGIVGSSNDNPKNVCSTEMAKRPAVLINHQPCRDFFSGSCDTANPKSAIVKAIEDCSTAVELVVHGNRTVATQACPGSTDRYAWTMGSADVSGSRSLKSALTHEFGHVLGIGHSDDASPSVSNAVMESTTNDERQLWPWDKDCADDYNQGRSAKYHYLERDRNGPWSSVVEHSNLTTKGMLSGNMVRSYGGSPYYNLYTDTVVRYGYVNTNGILSFSSTSNTLPTAAQDLWVNPVTFVPWERSPGTGGNANRMNFNYSPSNGYDPPTLRYIRADGSGIFNTTWSGSYYAGGTLLSHIPLTAGWDEVSGNTVFARVNTNRPWTGSGEIYLHPGFSTSSTNTTLRLATKVPQDDPPTLSGTWDYTITTDFAPAVTCADDRSTFGYNCMIAWKDAGGLTGSVLYAYFRVNTSTNAIEWRGIDNPDVEVHPAAETASHISLAWMEDRFWLAWKEQDHPRDVVVSKHSTTTYGSWSTDSTTSAVDIVDPPFFNYSPRTAREWGVIWTEVP